MRSGRAHASAISPARSPHPRPLPIKGRGDVAARFSHAIHVERNRLKRRLRAAFEEVANGLPADHDYVLIARPGLGGALESNGFPWLTERVAEVLSKERA